MRFLARIKKDSHVDRLWRGNRRVGGRVGAVAFRLAAGTYQSVGELDESQVAAIRANPSVELEALALSLPPPPEPEKKSVGRVKPRPE